MIQIRYFGPPEPSREWYPTHFDRYDANNSENPIGADHIELDPTALAARQLRLPPEPGPDWAGLLSTFRSSSLRSNVRFVDNVRVQRILSDLQLLLASTRELSELQPLLQGLVNELNGAGSPLSAAQISQLNTVLANNNFSITITSP